MELESIKFDPNAITPEVREQLRRAAVAFRDMSERLRNGDDDAADEVRRILQDMAVSATHFQLEVMLLGPMALSEMIARGGVEPCTES